MRVVVTGAAGMIGSNLVHGLNAAGKAAKFGPLGDAEVIQ